MRNGSEQVAAAESSALTDRPSRLPQPHWPTARLPMLLNRIRFKSMGKRAVGQCGCGSLDGRSVNAEDSAAATCSDPLRIADHDTAPRQGAPLDDHCDCV